MTIFKLPDLGEGLQEAEIREWHVSVGEEVKTDQPLVSVETDKAVVEIPSPRSGRIQKLNGNPGDILEVGAPLVEFEGDAGEEASDKGTVVGRVEVGEEVVTEKPTTTGQAAVGVKAMPAVRALAQRLNVDISIVTPSGPDGTITAADVQRAARVLEEVGPLEPLRGVRRAMARSMTQAHAEVTVVTIVDDADIDAWKDGQDVSLRLIRAIVAACKAEPSLNAWYETHAVGRRVIEKIDLGIAVDTEDGLFVPVLHDVANRDSDDLRKGLERLKADVKARTVPPEELRGYTFTLSNFGMIGGRYADPVVVPPTVGILGAGHVRDEVVAVDRKPAVHRILPLSLSFDHRAVTGGEATRFLVAVMKDLQLPD
ncbi:MAG: dihydrolipoamide acetyltransferase family protein [Acidiferrobacterales bacterium]